MLSEIISMLPFLKDEDFSVLMAFVRFEYFLRFEEKRKKNNKNKNKGENKKC